MIPSFNRAKFICAAIDSVLAQTCDCYEIIVVDDGSTDGTASLLGPYLDRITLVQQPNRGVAAARNHGIRLSRGEFVCFLDSDDLWMEDKLRQQLQFADAHPEYGLIATEITSFDEGGVVATHAKSGMYTIPNGRVTQQLLFTNWIQTSTVMVRRACLSEVGGFAEDVGQFGEDWLLWMLVSSRYPIYFLREPLVFYRVHPQNLSTYQPESQYASLMLILQKLRSLPQFAGDDSLLKEASYRISLGRGRQDMRAGAYMRAVQKLRLACANRKLPWKAWLLLLYAELRLRLTSKITPLAQA